MKRIVIAMNIAMWEIKEMTVVSDKTRRRIEELQKGEKRNKRVLGKGMVVAKLQKGLKDKVS